MKTDTDMKKIQSCILCGSSEFEFLYFSKDRMFSLPGKFIINKCRHCSLVFLNPQPGKNLLIRHYPSQKYYSYSRSKDSDLFKIIRGYLIKHYYSPNILSSLISNFIQNIPAIPSYVANGRILDIGCGDGDTLDSLKKLGWETYGLDISSKAVAIANKKGHKVKRGTFKALSKYPDNYFDAIRLYHVIEHIDDPSSCMSLIGKKLKREGELLIGTPSIASPLAIIFKSYWYNLDSPRHLFLFSPRTLKKLLNRHNFLVKKIEFCSAGGIPGSLQYVARDVLTRKIELIKIPIVLLFFPVEWLLNKLGVGDVFVVRSSKK